MASQREIQRHISQKALLPRSLCRVHVVRYGFRETAKQREERGNGVQQCRERGVGASLGHRDSASFHIFSDPMYDTCLWRLIC